MCSSDLKALKEIDLDEFREQTKTRVDLIEQAKSNESGILTVSGEEYDRLIESNDELSKTFIQNLDGSYSYIGTMENLISALDKNSQAQYDTAKEEYTNKLGGAEIADNGALPGMSYLKDNGTENLSDLYMISVIKQFQEKSIAAGLDISKMGIDDLSNDTIVTKDLGTETLTKIVEQILGLIEQKNEIEEKSKSLEEINAQEAATALSNLEISDKLEGQIGRAHV